MKKNIFLVALLFFHFLEAQQNNQSLRYLESNSNLFAKKLVKTEGGVVVVGTIQGDFGQTPYTGGFICQTDDFGIPMWNKTFVSFGNVFSFQHALPMSDSSIIAFGTFYNPISALTDGAWLHLDKNGNLITKFGLNSLSCSSDANAVVISDAIVDSDSTLVLVGHNECDSSAFILRSSKQGQLIWHKTFKDSNNLFLKFHAIETDTNHYFYVVGGVYNGENAVNGVFVKLDSIGDFMTGNSYVSTSAYGAVYTDVLRDQTHLYIRHVGIGSFSEKTQVNAILKMDLEGTNVWQYQINQSNTDMQAVLTPLRTIAFDNDSNLVVYSNDISIAYFNRLTRDGLYVDDKLFLGRAEGFVKGAQDTCFFLVSGPSFGIKSNLITNDHFAISWSSTFESVESSCSWEGVVNADNQAFVSAAYFPLQTSGQYQLVNAMMEEATVFVTADYSCVDYISSLEEESKLAFKFYPNPASETLTISLPENTLTTDCILVDNAGKEVKRFSVSGGENLVDVSELESGIYLMKVGTHLQKIIKN